MPVYDITGSECTFVAKNDPAENYSFSGIFAAGRVGSTDNECKAFVRFANASSYAGIPSGARIQDAKLVLYARTMYNNASSTYHGFYANTASWSPTNLTYNNHTADGVNFNRYNLNFLANERQFSQIDVTDWLLGAMGSSSMRSLGFRITSRGTDNSFGHRTDFDSGKGTNKPYIRVTYDAAMPTLESVAVRENGSTVDIVGSGVAGAEKISVLRSTSASGGFSYIKDANLSANGSGFTASDAPSSALPSAPGGISASPVSGSTNKIAVSWNAATQAGQTFYYSVRRELSDGTTSLPTASRSVSVAPSVTAYLVERSESGGAFTQIATVDATATRSYTDTVTAGRQYRYRVRAQNAQGAIGAYSSEASSSVVLPSVPTFDSVTIVGSSSDGTRRFRLAGGGAESQNAAKILVYTSENGTTFSGSPAVFNTTSASWDTSPTDMTATPQAPPAPVHKAPVLSGRNVLLSWTQGANPTLTRYFKVAQRIGTVDSSQSGVRNASYVPAVTVFRLFRRTLGATSFPTTPLYEGANPHFEDATGVSGTTYEYRVSSANEKGVASGFSQTFTATHPLPEAPRDLVVETVERTDANGNPLGGRSVRVLGAGFDGADRLVVERSLDGTVWTIAGNATSGTIAGRAGIDWYFTDNPPTPNPQAVAWRSSSASREGVYLAWDRPENPPGDYLYRAHRVKDSVKGNSTPSKGIRLVPAVTGFALERRLVDETNPTAQSGDYAFRHLRTFTTEQEYTDPIDNLAEGAIRTDSRYEWRIRAVNDLGGRGTYSETRTHDTYRLPEEAPPPAPPPKPRISSAYPSADIEIASGSVFAAGFVYNGTPEGSDPDGTPDGTPDAQEESPLSAISLTLTETVGEPGGDVNLYRYDGVRFVTATPANEGLRFASREPVLYLPTNLPDSSGGYVSFGAGATYTLTFRAVSAAGGISDALETSFRVTRFSETRAQVVRSVSRVSGRQAQMVRTVRTQAGGYRKSLVIEWYVKERVSPRPAPESYAGGESTRPWQVSDATGRPEPYAEVDFQQGRFTKTFYADERGRFQIRIPRDLRPGIYTVRERGPSMAPRTFDNIPIVDPAALYSHAKRHEAGGQDPVFITDAQVSPAAAIAPEKVAGAEGLAALVSRFYPPVTNPDGTPDEPDITRDAILAGIERTATAGQPASTVSGCSATVITETDPETNQPVTRIAVSSGRVREDGRLREVPSRTFDVVRAGATTYYLLYVSGGEVVMEPAANPGAQPPPGKPPLAFVTVPPGTAQITTSERHVTHPAFTTSGATPRPPDSWVRWGPREVSEILYRGQPLGEFLDSVAKERDSRARENARLASEFRGEAASVRAALDSEETARVRARDVTLAASEAFGAALLLRGASGDDVPRSKNLVLFRGGEEVSSLTTLDIVRPANPDSRPAYTPAYLKGILAGMSEAAFARWVRAEAARTLTPGYATFPEGFSSATAYTLRTLAVPLARSTVVRVMVLAERSSARLLPEVSLTDGATYFPKQMARLSVREVQTDDTPESLELHTFEARFTRSGTEAILNLAVRPGISGQGDRSARIRGLYIAGA